jgi:hypothetical protein
VLCCWLWWWWWCVRPARPRLCCCAACCMLCAAARGGGTKGGGGRDRRGAPREISATIFSCGFLALRPPRSCAHALQYPRNCNHFTRVVCLIFILFYFVSRPGTAAALSMSALYGVLWSENGWMPFFLDLASSCRVVRVRPADQLKKASSTCNYHGHWSLLVVYDYISSML